MNDLTHLVVLGVMVMVISLCLTQISKISRCRASAPQSAPFLGGGSPRTHAWQRYHVRYYPMTLLFIAFEMEMMFMYPWAVVFVAEGMKALMEMGMFLAILSVGILYAWREGVFRWQ